MKKLLGLILLLCLSATLTAQRGGTEDNRALKYYEEGMQAKRFNRYEQAEILFQKALERDPNYLDAMFDLGELYMRMERLDRSVDYMEKIVNQDPRYVPDLIINLAQIAQSKQDYSKAKAYYEQYMGIAPEGSNNYKAAKRGAASCEFAQWATKNPVPFDPINMGAAVNSEWNEYFPAMTADESLLIFTREIHNPNNPYVPNGIDEEFYFCEKNANNEWGQAYNPGPPINSPWREGAPTISPDGKYVIFTICELYGMYGQDKEGFGSCDLFVSVRQGKEWSKPVNMGRTINSKHWETQPCFASDGKTLYFIRGMYNQERQKSSDIYFTELINGKWSQAQPLPFNINTDQNEESVFIHPDNQTLYFSSEGHVGMGKMDIFMSKRKADGGWEDPVNVGYPINTSDHENSFFVSADGSYAVIASNRDGGYGGLDLYKFELPEALRPNPVTYLAGTIKDADNKLPLQANFKLMDLTTGDTVVQSFSDQKNGSFLVVLPSGKNYALIAEKDGYLYHSEHFALETADERNTYTKHILLEPIKAGKSVVLKNVFFDTDRFELKAASQTELNKLAQLMKEKKEMRIELSGHTDNQGNANANLVLSENRAKAVYEYLIANGIDANRMTYKGYGATKPIADNGTESGRAQNRRTEFMVLE